MEWDDMDLNEYTRELREIRLAMIDDEEEDFGMELMAMTDALRDIRSDLKKAGPPGPPPRPGLEWNEQSSRWIRPDEAGVSQRQGEDRILDVYDRVFEIVGNNRGISEEELSDLRAEAESLAGDVPDHEIEQLINDIGDLPTANDEEYETGMSPGMGDVSLEPDTVRSFVDEFDGIKGLFADTSTNPPQLRSSIGHMETVFHNASKAAQEGNMDIAHNSLERAHRFANDIQQRFSPDDPRHQAMGALKDRMQNEIVGFDPGGAQSALQYQPDAIWP